MQVYVVITNGEIAGEVEGVFKEYEDAKAKLNLIKKDWKEYAGDDVIEEDDESEDYYSVTTSAEFMEVNLVSCELK